MLTQEGLQSDLHTAIRAKDDVRKRTLRMALTAIKLAEVEKRDSLDESELIAVLQKETKMRHEGIEESKRAQREDLIPPLESELAVLQSYLPEPLTPEELQDLAREAIAEAGATNMQEMGKVMKLLMPKVQGRADGKIVSDTVRALLTGS